MKKLAPTFACALLLAACGATNEGKPDAKPSDTATEAVAPRVVDIAIKDGKVAQQGKRVEVKIDQPITLRVTTDTVDEVHVHSEPQHEFDVAPGPAKDYTFGIGTPGQVSVESHHLRATIVQLVVRP